MQIIPRQSILKHIIIEPAKIHFLRFIFEAYEGIASITTLDAKLGLVRINIAPGCEDEVARIIEAEGEDLQLRNVVIG
ncbi:MAG: DUF4911 domain-containing protein [Syntrophobacteraceae bacterium]